MKKFLLAAAILCAGISVKAQEYKPFKLGLGLGYTMPSDGGGGILFDLEPAYRINDDIAVGLRIESAAMARAIGETEASISANGSYTINGQYYLSTNTVRPYVGLGFGIFSLASITGSETGGSVAAGSEFGVYPRVGLDIGHFNINLDYNIIGSSDVIASAGDADTKVKNSYLGIRIGAFIFGGKK